jgi:hypothetical protein
MSLCHMSLCHYVTMSLNHTSLTPTPLLMSYIPVRAPQPPRPPSILLLPVHLLQRIPRKSLSAPSAKHLHSGAQLHINQGPTVSLQGRVAVSGSAKRTKGNRLPADMHTLYSRCIRKTPTHRLVCFKESRRGTLYPQGPAEPT